MKRITAFIIMLMTLLISGCWSSVEVNTIGLSVCIGIDKTEKGYFVSEQVINPEAIASEKATYESPVVIYTDEGENIQEILARMTTSMSRLILHSHLRMVILGEEIAREGIAELIDYFLRHREFRTDFYFAIARGISVEELLDTLTPIEPIPGMAVYKELEMSREYWAPTKAVRIVELANALTAEGLAPTINAVELVGKGSEADSTDILKQSTSIEKIKFTEVGVFQGDRLVGWLDENEARGYSFITGSVRMTSGHNTDESGSEITTEIIKATSRIKAAVTDDQPRIDVAVKVKYTVNQVKGPLDVSKIENLEKINRLLESRISDQCNQSVRKAQELKADIFGFGERLHTKAPAYWKTVKDNWGEAFAEVSVNVTVKAELVSIGDLTKTLVQK